MKPLLNRAEVEAILQRYLDGGTTLEEEKQLRAWFSASDVPNELAHYRPMLEYFSAEHQETYPGEVQKPTMQMQIADHKKGRPKRIIYIWTSIAAVIVFVALGLNYIHLRQVEAEKEALLARQNELNLKAFADMANALMLVSETLNKGLSPVTQAANAADVTGEGKALNAIGNALTAINKVTTMLMPTPAEEASMPEENSGI